MNFRRAAILAVMDILLLAELCLAIWWGQREPAEIAWRFMQVFLPAAAATVLGTRWAFRRWAPKVKVSAEQAGRQPWRPVDLFGALGRSPGRREP